MQQTRPIDLSRVRAGDNQLYNDALVARWAISLYQRMGRRDVMQNLLDMVWRVAPSLTWRRWRWPWRRELWRHGREGRRESSVLASLLHSRYYLCTRLRITPSTTWRWRWATPWRATLHAIVFRWRWEDGNAASKQARRGARMTTSHDDKRWVAEHGGDSI